MDINSSETLELESKTVEYVMPENWSDLPVHILTSLMKQLPGSDLKSMHLVCRRFDEVASYFVPHTLLINYASYNVHTGNDQPVRYFDEISIESCVFDSSDEEFQRMIRLIAETGVHVKKFRVIGLHCSSIKNFLDLLLLLPNIEILELCDVTFDDEEELTNEKVKLKKLKMLNFTYSLGSCPSAFLEDFVLNNLEGFALKQFVVCTENTPKFIPFLKSHEKSLRKLKIEGWGESSEELVESLGSFQNLRLEYFNIYQHGRYIRFSDKFLNFLRQQRASLKSLKIFGLIISDKVMNCICESLPNLESLKLYVHHYESEPLSTESTDNLWKLKKLKKLRIDFSNYNFNYLRGLGMAVNENLQTLEFGYSESIPTSFITTLPSFIPNIKTVKIGQFPCEFIDLLKLFENLEHLELELRCFDEDYLHRHKLVPMNDVVAKNLKYLKINSSFVLDPPTASKISRDYPNLETIKIPKSCEQRMSTVMDECVEILLKNLKNLNHFYVRNRGVPLSKQILMHIKNYGKKLTYFCIGRVDFKTETVREVLKDFKNLHFISLASFYGMPNAIEVKF